MTKYELTILVESLLTRVAALEEKLDLIMYGMGPRYNPPDIRRPCTGDPFPYPYQNTCQARGTR